MKNIILLLVFVFFAGATSVMAGGVKTMDKDELKAMLDSPELVVLDVRTGKDWSSSEYKIKGAVRLMGKDVSKAMGEFGKESTIVLYCA